MHFDSANSYTETIIRLRDDHWLQDLFDDIWERYFSDIPRLNEVAVEFARHWKSRLGLIRMSETHSRTYVGVNGLLRHTEVPEVIVRITAAHELCHYSHGFGSPLPRLFAHPHAGNVVGIELERRGLGGDLVHYTDWMADCWSDFCAKHFVGHGRPRLSPAAAHTRAAAAAGTRR